MNLLDWVVLSFCLLLIVGYGTYKTRRSGSLEHYLKGGNQMNWLTIGLSVMATQASAITFISTPGLAFESGMSFVQNYFGLPIALIIVSAFFIPSYYRLKVFTAYEYLEHRFDVRIRTLTAFLFLIQRGLAAGITIYAPAIILSTALEWNLNYTILFVGILVIIYTVSGGTRAVSVTQKWQMAVILLGMSGVFFYLIYLITDSISLNEGLKIAGINDRMNIVNFSFDPGERYTFWTGITGGLFLALSYFGTDQSQVQRYIGGKDATASRIGLMFNALLKVPMQFFILLTGVLVFVYFELNPSPLLFNQQVTNEIESSAPQEFKVLREKHTALKGEKKLLYTQFLNQPQNTQEIKRQIQSIDQSIKENKAEAQVLYDKVGPGVKSRESDYVFLYFILNHLPHGIIGLLLCVIISAAMSSTSGEINALAATTSVDFVRRFTKGERRPRSELLISKFLTLFWGILAIAFAWFAHLAENLIEAVNILGSLFYGTILGIFLVAFFIKKINSTPVFLSAILVQSGILISYFMQAEGQEIAYLWYNLIGCGGVVLISTLFHFMFKLNPSHADS
jgi:Na+/proline symporter